ncbi:SIS domain-containing protein [Pelagibacterium montanilacus]|uniref:SIS domain-containing protein n=1 Tax=Pelagibacterium montanilacus TaxID=2185280 RepID=UPI000F8D2EB5|nr:SIS domain-containing protein [Pelagibacterium montanilacus]
MTSTMEREITAQAVVLPDLQNTLAAACAAIGAAQGRVFAGGCGDSAFAPLALADVSRALGLEVDVRTAMEIACFTPLSAGDTVVLSSISGGTRRTVEAARVARETGARVISVTCKGESALAQTSDQTIVLPYTPISRKTPHTLDYGVTLVALAEVARALSGREGAGFCDVAAQLPDMLRVAEAAVAPAARTWKADGKAIFLGAGADLGSAKFAAAKFHEAGGLTAMAEETENFIHGMNFMLEPDDALFVLASTPAGHKRGQEIARAFAPLCATSVIAPETLVTGTPESAYGGLFDMTFRVQHLCFKVFGALGLELEEPRAGRANGPAHLEAQSAAMAN